MSHPSQPNHLNLLKIPFSFFSSNPLTSIFTHFYFKLSFYIFFPIITRLSLFPSVCSILSNRSFLNGIHHGLPNSLLCHHFNNVQVSNYFIQLKPIDKIKFILIQFSSCLYIESNWQNQINFHTSCRYLFFISPLSVNKHVFNNGTLCILVCSHFPAFMQGQEPKERVLMLRLSERLSRQATYDSKRTL